jgi:hypothetical protein
LRDDLGGHVKYAAPTVANGEVFVGLGNGFAIFGQRTTSSASVAVPAASTQNALAVNDDHARIKVDAF